MLKSDTFSFPRNLIKTNRKEVVVMSGQVYSNAAPHLRQKMAWERKRPKPRSRGSGGERTVLKCKSLICINPPGRKVETSESLSWLISVAVEGHALEVGKFLKRPYIEWNRSPLEEVCFLRA